jgi:hypothetical protein
LRDSLAQTGRFVRDPDTADIEHTHRVEVAAGATPLNDLHLKSRGLQLLLDDRAPPSEHRRLRSRTVASALHVDIRVDIGESPAAYFPKKLN